MLYIHNTLHIITFYYYILSIYYSITTTHYICLFLHYNHNSYKCHIIYHTPIIIMTPFPPYTLYIGLAINCLANITTHDLARDCLSDLVNLMTSHKSAYVRKKAVRYIHIVILIIILYDTSI